MTERAIDEIFGTLPIEQPVYKAASFPFRPRCDAFRDVVRQFGVIVPKLHDRPRDAQGATTNGLRRPWFLDQFPDEF
jgi:hypothetical protein